MEDDKYVCKLCDKKCVDGGDSIFCTGPCSRKYHWKCIGFTPVSINFYRTCDNLSFECDECRDNPYKIMSVTLNKILSFMSIFNERLHRQETNSEAIDKNFETLNSNLQKYESEMKAELINLTTTVKNGHKTSEPFTESTDATVHDAVVLVQPKNIQNCSATRADLERKNISKDSAVCSVNNLPKGGIELKCKNVSEQSKLHAKTIIELGNDYAVVIPKPRNPKIRVENMSEKFTDVNIITSMKKQNEFLKDSDMKVLHIFEVKHTESYGAIIEVDPNTFKKLMSEKKVDIGTNTCVVKESLSVLRCFKCCGYNHKSNVCKNKKACLRCGGEHIIKECKATRNECINCKVLAEKLNENLDVNHPAWSKACTVMQRNIDKAKRRINYGQH